MESYCLVCGKPADESEHCISGGENLYEDEGEWVCSDECYKEVAK